MRRTSEAERVLHQVIDKVFDLRIKLKKGRIITDADLWKLQLFCHETVDEMERKRKAAA